jgi:dipeptidyl aminopeptidase/acylaminoacyl peptidase
MVTGRRPFQAPTGVDMIANLLTREPPEMAAPSGPVPPALEQVVRRCLQKDRDQRFQSARDVAFALEALLAVPTTGAGQMRFVPPSRVGSRLAVAAGLVAALALAGMAGLWWGARFAKAPPSFRQLTFQVGWINYARFAPDGRTVIYTAAWDGRAPEVYSTRTDTRESRPLGFPHAALLSVSSTGQLAILKDPLRGQGLFTKGTLATVPLGGGAPRDLLENVREADWTPDGKELAVLLDGKEQRIELPAGNVLYRAAGSLRLMRVSPDGARLAFIEGTEAPLALTVVERSSGRATVLAADLPGNLFGLAWAPTGGEVLFSAGETAAQRDILAVDLSGRRRTVYRSLVSASLLDIAADGRALLHRGFDRWGTRARLFGSITEDDLSVFNASVPASISGDGRTALIYEFSEAAGSGATYVGGAAHRPAVRISEGSPFDISADGQMALVRRGSSLFAVPAGPGLPWPLKLGAVSPRWAKWVPTEASQAVVAGHEAGRPLRLWLVSRVAEPRAVSPESGFAFFAVAPDGKTVATRLAADSVDLLPLDGGSPRSLSGIAPDFAVGSYAGDGQSLFLIRTSVTVPCEVHRLELATGKITPWLRVSPSEITGINQCSWMNLSADGHSYAYAYFQSLGDLFLAEGLK